MIKMALAGITTLTGCLILHIYLLLNCPYYLFKKTRYRHKAGDCMAIHI